MKKAGQVSHLSGPFLAPCEFLCEFFRARSKAPEKEKTRKPADNNGFRVELLGRFELPTSSLPRMRSTY